MQGLTLKCSQGQSDWQLFPLLCNWFYSCSKIFPVEVFYWGLIQDSQNGTVESLSFALCVAAVFDLVCCNRTLLGLCVCVKQQRCCCVWSHPKGASVAVCPGSRGYSASYRALDQGGRTIPWEQRLCEPAGGLDRSCWTSACCLRFPVLQNLLQVQRACRRCDFVDLSLSSIATATTSHCSVPSAWLPEPWGIRNWTNFPNSPAKQEKLWEDLFLTGISLFSEPPLCRVLRADMTGECLEQEWDNRWEREREERRTRRKVCCSLALGFKHKFRGSPANTSSPSAGGAELQ